MSNYISRGSEWRRWDLHVHTKGTMKNDQFVSPDFDSFCLTMFRIAIQNNVDAIGITDYFNIDNYNKVKNFVGKIDGRRDCTEEEKIKIKNIFILPNVELRIMPVTDKGSLINIHCLFNPEYTLKLENNFFGSLEHAGHKMNRQGLIEFGRSSNTENNDLSDDAAYKKGVNSFVITHDHLQQLLRNRPELKENTLIVISNSSNDGASGLQEHYTDFENEPGNLDSVRKELYKMSDAIFSGNNRDREYFLGEKDGNNENTIIEKCGSLKPCIHGSDAHTEKQLFNPSKNRYCWIKSDLTFEGLKQILYDPEDRVRIQEIKPDDKESYRIIDSVQFGHEKFMTDKIYINQNLTAIIGGKSTGKTLLLGSISQTIDPEEVESRLKDAASQRSKAITNFEVTWKDDQQNRSDMSEAESDENEQNSTNKKIIYIPQSYLNRLVEEEGGESIHKIIEDVLKQEKGNIYADLADFEREQNRNIVNGIVLLFNYIENIAEQSEELRNIGDKKGIEIEIKKIEGEITELKKTTGMSDEEIENYNNLVKKIKAVNDNIEKLQLDKSELDELKKLYLFENINLPELSQPLFNKVNTFYEKLRKETQDQWKNFIDGELTNLSNQIKSNESNLRKIESEFNPLLEKAKKSYALEEKIKQIDIQQIKLKDIQKKEKLKQKTAETARETLTNLIKLSDSFYVRYEQYKEEILKQNIISDGLEFSLAIQHKTKSFQENFINDVFDIRKLSSDLSNYEYKDNKEFSEKLDSLVRGILNNKLALKNRYTSQQAITKLLQNWYKYDYQITQDGDDISQMSPGKRSLILLKLLIELDNSKCPILLDQPEDDLDNRSVYNDLVKFIKNKKKERQIIIVTHNPNLVVGADAECVIVANQRGSHSENKEYQFEYVSGALENTFLKNGENNILYRQGIREHVCDILEGGNEAFLKREKKYGLMI